LKRDTESARLPTATSAEAGVGEQRRIWSKVIVTAAIAVVVFAATSYFYFHRPPKLTSKDTIVTADFNNTTGDAVFDGTLRQGLAVQLDQSPFLSLISDERIQQMLRLMGQPANAKLTPAMKMGMSGSASFQSVRNFTPSARIAPSFPMSGFA
jgi:hypothetical protein